MIDETKDIDIWEAEIRLKTLKRRNNVYRIVPVPKSLIDEILKLLTLFPDIKGRIFKLDPSNVRKVFYKCGDMAGIPKDMRHPHILRHTRAIELLRAGVPVTAVQSILGHSSLNTTATYLKFSNVEIKSILEEKGVI